MSTSIHLLLSSTEESYSFQCNSSDELMKYILTNLKITHFNLITERGEKINKRNLPKLNDYFTSLNHSLSFLLISSAIQSKGDDTVSHSVKEAFDNQKKIKSILNAYFKNTIEKINNRLQLLNGLQVKYSKHKEFLSSNFNSLFGQFKTFFHYTAKDSIQNDFDIIEQAVVDYNKVASLYQEQLKSVNVQAKNIISIYEWNINSNLLQEDREGLSLDDKLRAKAFNSQLLQGIIEKESDSAKKELLNKIAEISLYKKNLEHAKSITNIPQMFITDAKEIQSELLARKNFDYCFTKLMHFIQNGILFKEEERRKTFCVWLNLQNKNELYSKFINVLYENNAMNENPEKEVNSHIEEVVRQLDCQLNSLTQMLYQPAPINGTVNNGKRLNDIPLCASVIVNNEPQFHLQSICFELGRILKENFKIPSQDEGNMALPEKISLQLRTLSERLKANSGMNNQLLDISNASLAYSIMIDEKQPNFHSYLNPNQSPSPNISPVSLEMEKFVAKHESKLYFYESLYEFIEDFGLRNKVHFTTNLNKDTPQSLGNAIEQLLKDGLEVKKKYNKCIHLLKQLKTPV